MGTKQSRILLTAIMTAILSTPLRAETLVVNSYGGPYEEIIEKRSLHRSRPSSVSMSFMIRSARRRRTMRRSRRPGADRGSMSSS